ncbi:PKD domain-containing protein [Winogradskyella sp. DF17]|uniref:PKD domain-containing protein n=1 Tax=Winogradskyella pelagia TaxID=2819984 RepID=A0ABS3T1Z6_9FLAO|nr:PKD domain-containing protein [Winogradskyella sp. DF17]MBO3116774.1 PKD domain-containing protein [Winogradskyella sp. DF17]
MKALKLIPQLWILISLLLTIHITAQNNIVGYEYAFDDGNPPTYVAVMPAQAFNLVTDIDVSTLNNDVNVFYIRFKDELGQWSSIASKIFVKPPEAFITASTIVGYEYGFDDDNPPTYVPITPTADFNLVTDIDVSSLQNDVNILHIRFKDDIGQWSSFISKIFVKPPETFATASAIVGYEYGFNDGENIQYTPINPNADFNLVTAIDVSSLPNDVNIFHIRFQDDIGQWSSFISKIFVKPPETFATASTIIGYEYGFNDGENIQYTPINPNADFNLVTDIDVSSLSNDVNIFHIRFQDDIGQWSSFISKIFVKPPEPVNFPNNTIVSYDYWFENDAAEKVSITIDTPVADYLLAEIDVSQLWAGEYRLNTQFKDTYGNYSVIMTDTINKAILPLAQFNQDAIEICTGETINFLNTSVDYDDQLWDFDDGTTSDLIDVSHTFNTPGTYEVSLLIEDTATGLTDTTTQTIEVYEMPSNTVTVSTSLPTCFGETVVLTADYTNGDYLWSNGATTRSISVTQEGTYFVDISNSNSMLCSATSDNITVSFESEIDNTITADATTITANLGGASYQWIDCTNGNTPVAGEINQMFAPTIDGEYAVEITVNGCTVVSDCIVMSNLSVEDYNLSTAVKLYPNPVRDMLSVKTDLDITVVIFNVLGNELNRIDLHSGEVQLDMSNYENGLYLVKVYRTGDSSNNSKLFRIVKR